MSIEFGFGKYYLSGFVLVYFVFVLKKKKELFIYLFSSSGVVYKRNEILKVVV